MILEFPNYIDSQMIDEIKSSIDKVKNTTDVYRPKKDLYSSSNREGKTLLIDDVPELKHIDNKLNQICSTISKDIIELNYNPVYPSGDSGYEYHCYEPYQICRPHGDGEITPGNSLLRFASIIIHLNTVEDGGELVFPMQNKTIKTEKGKLVIFPPYGMYQHYTTPSKETREVIVTWFVYNNINIQRI